MASKEEMLGKVVKLLTSSVMDLNTIYDLLDKLNNADWRAWLAELKKFLRKEPCWVKEEVPKVASPKMNADTHMWALSRM